MVHPSSNPETTAAADSLVDPDGQQISLGRDSRAELEERTATVVLQGTTAADTFSKVDAQEALKEAVEMVQWSAEKTESTADLNASFALSHEVDEELERALQHFGLGRFNKPFLYRPWHEKKTDLIQSQIIPAATAKPSKSASQVKSSEEVPVEKIADAPAAQPDMDTCNPEIYDEELVRALQHFNIGMENTPWIPRPKKTWAELMKDYKEEKARIKLEKSKQLQLAEDKVVINKTIHILGLGTAGKYIAHSLAGLAHGPPITLLMHRPRLMQQWHDEGAAIRILANGQFHVQTGFNIESSSDFEESAVQRVLRFGPNREHSTKPPTTMIDTLIVTTDAHTTLSALSAIRSRLSKSTTICIISDGLGIIEKINNELFPDSYDRPTYVLGRMSHRLASTERHFTIVEKSPGDFICSKLPQVTQNKGSYFSPTIKRSNFKWSPQAQHLVGTLIKVPELNTKSLGHKSFFASQLQTIVVASIIGPLSVAFDCSNDQLLYNYSVTQNMRYLLEELSRIIKSLPELSTLFTIPLYKRFSVDNLERIIVSCINTTGKNQSSMLQDVRAGDRTEIDFSVGYMIGRAKELGIECPRLEALLHIVKGKQAIKSREKNGYIPFEHDPSRFR